MLKNVIQIVKDHKKDMSFARGDTFATIMYFALNNILDEIIEDIEDYEVKQHHVTTSGGAGGGGSSRGGGYGSKNINNDYAQFDFELRSAICKMETEHIKVCSIKFNFFGKKATIILHEDD